MTFLHICVDIGYGVLPEYVEDSSETYIFCSNLIKKGHFKIDSINQVGHFNVKSYCVLLFQDVQKDIMELLATQNVQRIVGIPHVTR